MRRATMITALLLAAGCTQYPEVDQAVGNSAKDLPYPTIAPVTQIDAAAADPVLDETFAEDFQKEVDTLDRRAKWLRQQQIQ